MNFNHIGNISTNLWKKGIASFKEKDWNEYTFRQNTFEVHQHTRTIYLLFDQDYRNDSPTHHPHYKKFAKPLKDVENILKNRYGNGHLIRALLILLKMKKSIPPHIDKGNSMEICHRVHIPITTTPRVFFTIDKETKCLKEGEMWEIDNSNKYHSVINKSRYNRIHLVVDWIVARDI